LYRGNILILAITFSTLRMAT